MECEINKQIPEKFRRKVEELTQVVGSWSGDDEVADERAFENIPEAVSDVLWDHFYRELPSGDRLAIDLLMLNAMKYAIQLERSKVQKLKALQEFEKWRDNVADEILFVKKQDSNE